MSEKQYIERYWRDATPADAIKEPPMVARFRDEPSDDWITDLLCGHDTRRGYWFSSSDDISQTTWWHCQVYDAPDPGEGWRLVDTEKEKPQEGDEVWVEGGKWEPVQESLYYGKRCAFRRRIEPPKPEYVPFTWEDREQLRGRWIGSNNGEMERSITTLHRGKFTIFVNGINASSVCDEWHFLDTGEPVGKKVME